MAIFCETIRVSLTDTLAQLLTSNATGFENPLSAQLPLMDHDFPTVKNYQEHQPSAVGWGVELE